MRTYRTLLIVTALLVAGTRTAEASDGATGGSAVLELFGLLLAFGCFLMSWKVLSIVRGGKLASAWQWVTSAVFVFAAGQALALLSYLAFVPVTDGIVVFMRIVSLGLLLLGMIKMRKALG